MAPDSSSITVNDAFFQPIAGLAHASPHTRPASPWPTGSAIPCTRRC